MKKAISFMLAMVLVLGVCLGAAGCSGPGSGGSEDNKKTEGNDKKNDADDGKDNSGDSGYTSENTKFDEAAFLKENIEGKGKNKDGKQMVIAMDVSDLASEFIIYSYEYIKLLLEKAGCKVIANNSNGNLTTQENNVSDYISMGVDAVILHAVDSKGSASYVKKLNDAGIPVLCIVKEIDGAKMDFHCSTSNNVETGYKAMEYIADNLDDAKVAVFQGTMGQSDAYLRQEGMEKCDKEKDNLEIVSNNPCEWDPSKAETMFKDALTANPDINAIILHSDCMDTGIESALKQTGRDKKVGEEGHIMWTGCDGDHVGLEMIRKGYMDWTVEQNPLTIAISTTKAILTKVAKGEDIGGVVIDNQTRAIDKDNVDDPINWGNYDVKSGKLWVGTKDIWDNTEI